MNLDNIRIANFRNHELVEFQPDSSVMVIHGPNGSGKTSILEAIHYCAMTRGMAKSNDRECVAFGSDFFSIKSSFSSESGVCSAVRVTYTKEREKQVFVNEQELTSFSRHIGSIPCITFAPHEMAIVNGPPSERRRFLDSAICQYDRRYLDDLLQYKRMLQQRNALLAGMHGTCKNTETLDLWTEQLAFAAASIVLARVRFIRLFGELFSSVYALLLKNEQPHLRYHCSLGKVDHEPSVNDLTYNFIDRYKENIPYEIQRGQTLAGPHRDEILLSINGREIKKYSSQGQQRSFLIGMKLSLHQYLHEQNGEKPISLLDDLFSELDTKRTGDILDILTTYGQVLITSTEMKKAAGVTVISVEDLKKKAEENHVEG